MTLADLRAYLRERLHDNAQPYLWSDATLNGHINEAQAEANLRARLLWSALESSTYKVTLAASTRDYAENASVLYVDQCVLASTGQPLRRITQTRLNAMHSNWRTVTGTPRYFLTDLAPKTFTVYPTPTAIDTVYRRVWYKPATLVNDGDTPGIEDIWHREMAAWALWRALSAPETDRYAPELAKTYLDQFTGTFGVRPSANQILGWQQYGVSTTARARAPQV